MSNSRETSEIAGGEPTPTVSKPSPSLEPNSGMREVAQKWQLKFFNGLPRVSSNLADESPQRRAD
jgi:hypothetical protein